MRRLTELAHDMVRRTLHEGDWAIDATVGNGHDTLFLAACVGASGRVFGFDVQAAAIAATGERCASMEWVSLIHGGHETMSERLPDAAADRVGAVMFNLGYLPGAGRDRRIITTAATTIAALRQACALLRRGGIMSVMVYPGHGGGAEEAAAVDDFAAGLGQAFAVERHTATHRAATSPHLLVIAKQAHS